MTDRFSKRLAIAAILVPVPLALPALAAPAHAQEESVEEMRKRLTIQIGDPAPPIEIQTWLKGEPIRSFDADKIYVIEFNATWCAPCRKAAPHMSRLYDEYRDVVHFASIFATEMPFHMEDGSYTARIKYLVDSMGDRMRYPVAVADAGGKTRKGWKVVPLPMSYIVKGGKVVWAGQPLFLDRILPSIRDGSFDSAAAVADYNTYIEVFDNSAKLMEEPDLEKAVAALDAIIKEYPFDPYYYGMKYNLLKRRDRARADEFLRWLIDADIDAFDWFHFVSNSYNFDNPDWDLALRVADKGISTAETSLIAAQQFEEKAKIYIARSAAEKDPVLAKADLKRARDVLEEGRGRIASSPFGGDQSDYQKKIDFLDYRYFAGLADDEADALLARLLSEKSALDWQSYVSAGLKGQKAPNYALLLKAAELAVEQADERFPFNRPMALLTKAEVHAAQGDKASSLAACDEAMQAARDSEQQVVIDEIAKAIAQFKARSNF